MEVFPISPASAKPFWLLGSICVVLALILVALAYTAYSSRHSRVELHSDRIRLAGDFWGRAIPLGLLEVCAARIVDLEAEPELSPRRRTLGTGLPGYASGWFRLRGGQKALVYLTRRQRVVHIPTSEGYALLLSIEEPERFIETLQQRVKKL
jgi:hypothetical protein